MRNNQFNAWPYTLDELLEQKRMAVLLEWTPAEILAIDQDIVAVANRGKIIDKDS